MASNVFTSEYWAPVKHLPLLGDDRLFIWGRMNDLRPTDPHFVLQHYAFLWAAYAEAETRPGASADNAGRFAANSWLRELTREDLREVDAA